MISINGKLYSSYNNVPSHIIKSFIQYTVFDYHLRVENGKILFWEKNYFMMMAQLRRLRINIPMSFTLNFFVDQINVLIDKHESECYLIYLKFANDSAPMIDNIEVDLITSIIAEPTNSLIKNISLTKEISLFKDHTLRDQELTSILYLQKDINRIAAIEAFENSCDDNLILNDKKNIIRSVLGNVFILKDDLIISPSKKNGAQSSVLADLFIEHINDSNDFNFSNDSSFGVFELQIADELAVLSIKNGLNLVCKYRKKNYHTKRLPKLYNSFIKLHVS